MKRRVVAIGLYSPGTGFTRVLESLFHELKDKCEIHWLGIGYRGDLIDRGYMIYPSNLRGGDMYGAYEGLKMVKEFNADTVFFLNDFWMLKNYQRVFNDPDLKVQKIAYVPLDGQVHEADTILGCEFVDHLVMYTQFAKAETTKAFSQLINEGKITAIPQLHIINHGVDLSSFRKLKREVKSKIFPQLSKDSIVVLNANRYTERKGIPLTLEAFTRSIKSVSTPIYLCLHTPGIEREHLKELHGHINRLEISERVIINPLSGNNYVNDNALNELYNACDIGLNTTYGEGWGLISFEHAAAGGAQVVPDHTSCTELWSSAGKVIPCHKDVVFSRNPFTMSEIDVEACAKVLNEFYLNKEALTACQEACCSYATESATSWNEASQLFYNIINSNKY
jgi:glycosyltransferase involved in cell wall biosynthesis